MRRAADGFTLVELLVVITIIVILLALLMPAMNQAIYQAELAQCAAKQDALASATVQYTTNHRRFYPYRTIVEGNGRSQPTLLFRNSNDNEIPVLSSFLNLNANLQDPLVKAVDLTIRTGGADRLGQIAQEGETRLTWIFYSIAYWGGWRFTDVPGRKGMRKLGDAFEYEGERYRMIASDHDLIVKNGDHVQSKHPDKEGVTYNLVLQNTASPYEQTSSQGVSTVLITYSTWTADTTTWRRGPIDMNAAFDDGSVRRYNDVPADTFEDDRMTWLPAHSDAVNYAAGQGSRVNVPRAGP